MKKFFSLMLLATLILNVQPVFATEVSSYEYVNTYIKYGDYDTPVTSTVFTNSGQAQFNSWKSYQNALGLQYSNAGLSTSEISCFYRSPNSLSKELKDCIKVEFVSNDGARNYSMQPSWNCVVSGYTDYYTTGDKILYRKPIYRTSKTFVGWYTDKALTIPFSFNTPLDLTGGSTMYLYAKYN